MTIVLIQIFSQKEKRVEYWTRILFHCLLIHKRCRWTPTWIQFFLRNSLVSHPISTVNFWLLDWATTYWILGKYSTRTPLAHRQFCQTKFLYSWDLSYSWWDDKCPSNFSHEYCLFQCYRHEHSSYHRMFFVIFCNIHRRLLSFPHLVIHPVQE